MTNEIKKINPRSLGRRTLDKLVPAMLGISLVLTIIAGVFSWTALNAAETRLAAEERQCERVQKLRIRVNHKAIVLYQLLNQAEDSNSNKADYYHTLKLTVDYEPPTNCERAVRQPENYVQMDSVPLYVLEQEKLFNPKTGLVDVTSVLGRARP